MRVQSRNLLTTTPQTESKLRRRTQHDAARPPLPDRVASARDRVTRLRRRGTRHRRDPDGARRDRRGLAYDSGVPWRSAAAAPEAWARLGARGSFADRTGSGCEIGGAERHQLLALETRQVVATRAR